jgi:hypothetical protein
MGNRAATPSLTLSDVTPSSLSSLEYKTGKLLLAAIQANNSQLLEDALETSRKQYVAEHAMTVGGDPYESLVKSMVKYLTRGYDVGDGPLFLKSPLQLCERLRADESAARINTELDRLSKAQTSSLTASKQGGPEKKDADDRVEQAKARLKAFNQTKQSK